MTDVSGATKLPDPTWNLVGYTAQRQARVQLGATAVVVNSLIDSSQDAPEFVHMSEQPNNPAVITEAKAVHKQQAARATRKAKQVGDPAKGVAIEDAKVNQEEGDE